MQNKMRFWIVALLGILVVVLALFYVGHLITDTDAPSKLDAVDSKDSEEDVSSSTADEYLKGDKSTGDPEKPDWLKELDELEAAYEEDYRNGPQDAETTEILRRMKILLNNFRERGAAMDDKTYEWDEIIDNWREPGPALYVNMSKVKTYHGKGVVAFNSDTIRDRNGDVLLSPDALYKIFFRGESPNGETLIYLEEDGYRIPKKEDRPTVSWAEIGMDYTSEEVSTEIESIADFVDTLESLSRTSEDRIDRGEDPHATMRRAQMMMAEDALRDYGELIDKCRDSYSKEKMDALQQRIEVAEETLRKIREKAELQTPAHGVRTIPKMPIR